MDSLPHFLSRYVYFHRQFSYSLRNMAFPIFQISGSTPAVKITDFTSWFGNICEMSHSSIFDQTGAHVSFLYTIRMESIVYQVFIPIVSCVHRSLKYLKAIFQLGPLLLTKYKKVYLDSAKKILYYKLEMCTKVSKATIINMYFHLSRVYFKNL